MVLVYRFRMQVGGEWVYPSRLAPSDRIYRMDGEIIEGSAVDVDEAQLTNGYTQRDFLKQPRG